jgi:argininosuccinate synthase
MTKSAFRQLRPHLTGSVTVLVYKGSVLFQASEGVSSSLYAPERSSMEAVGDYDHRDSEGFLNVLGVGAKAQHASGQTKA